MPIHRRCAVAAVSFHCPISELRSISVRDLTHTTTTVKPTSQCWVFAHALIGLGNQTLTPALSFVRHCSRCRNESKTEKVLYTVYHHCLCSCTMGGPFPVTYGLAVAPPVCCQPAACRPSAAATPARLVFLHLFDISSRAVRRPACLISQPPARLRVYCAVHATTRAAEDTEQGVQYLLHRLRSWLP